jgi:hypothetical protein
MLQQSILEAQINQIGNEIVQREAQRLSTEMIIEDATILTGNTGADNQLRNDAVVAANTLHMIDRQLETRHAKLAALMKEREALIAAATAQTAPPVAPAPVTPPVPAAVKLRQMKDEPKAEA